MLLHIYVPMEFGQGTIIPLDKTGDMRSLENYRAIKGVARI